MKKTTTLGAALVSTLALTACFEKDARESHIFTVEVEVTDTKGVVQKVKQDCNQLHNICQAKFELEMPSGKRTFIVNAMNQPVHEKEMYAKARNVKSQEEQDRLTDSEYKQSIYITGQGFDGVIQAVTFRTINFQAENWVPKTEKVIETKLMIPNSDLEIRVQEIKGELHKSQTQGDYARSNSLKTELHSLSMPDVKAADLKIRIY